MNAKSRDQDTQFFRLRDAAGIVTISFVDLRLQLHVPGKRAQ